MSEIRMVNGNDLRDHLVADTSGRHTVPCGDEPLRILVVQNNSVAGNPVARSLSALHPAWAMDLAHNLEAALESVEGASPNYDAAIVDLGLADATVAEDTPVRLRRIDPALPVVVLAGRPSNDIAETFIRCGIQEYLLKGQATTRQLAYSVRTAICRQSMQKDLEHAALHDCLTGILNRAGLESEFPRVQRQADRTGSRYALILCDLDRFKSVNDCYGHGVGDELLRGFASRIGAGLRPGDVFARIGGDEFAVLLDQVADIEQVVGTCARLAASVAEDFANGNTRLHAAASYGLALSPSHGTTLVELMQKADSAMYRAKRRGSTLAVAAT